MKNVRLSFSCSAEEKRLIQCAARQHKQSVSEFVRNAALREALIVLENIGSSKLSAAQFRLLNEIENKHFLSNATLSNALLQLDREIN